MRSFSLFIACVCLVVSGQSSKITKRSSDENVQEMAFRSIKPTVSYTDFFDARKAATQLLCGLDGVMVCTEFQALWSIDLNTGALTNVYDQNMYIGLYQYESADAFGTVSATMGASTQLPAFVNTVDLPCFTVVSGINGTVVDTDAFPYPQGLVGASAMTVNDGQLVDFDAAQADFLQWKSGLDGVGLIQTYEQQIPTFSTYARATTTYFDNFDAVQNFASQVADFAGTAAYTSTFTSNCYYIMQRVDLDFS